MNLNQSRVGLLATPTTPLWSGTVVSYTVGALNITLVVATVTGSLSSVQPDMAVWGGGDLARVQSVNAGANTIYLGENPVSANAGGGFVAGAAIAVYNIYQVLPKYERDETDYVVEDSDPSNQLSDWHISGASGQTLYFEVELSPKKVMLYNDPARAYENRVARGNVTGTSVAFEQRNNSGVSGSATIVASPITEVGQITIEAIHRFEDYNKDWASLGADDEAREKAAQKPIAITDKSALILGVGDATTVSGAGSFATYNGYAGGARAPATIASYAWSAPACLSIIGSSTSATVTVQYASDGFGYLTLTVTDSNGSTNVRHIPVWANVSPYALSGEVVLSQTLGIAPNIQPGGVEMTFTSYVAVSLYRFSLICLYDRDTNEPIFLGWLWDYKQNFDPGQNLIEISGTARDALATLKNTYSYSFHLTGKKDFALDWVDFNMLSIPRGIYFWENWHTTLYGVANLIWDTSPEDRLQYMVDFAPGNCYEAIQLQARSAFYDVYSDGLSNIRALVSLCYAATITGASYDALTRGILSSEGYSVIAKQFAVPTVSEVNTIAAYHTSLTAGLNFYEITVRAPSHPALMGNPTELEGLISDPLDISDPGYNEIIQFVGRHMANANSSNRVTFKTTASFSLLTYRMVDIPDEERLVIRELRDTFKPEGSYWEREITGQTFGRTVDAVIVPNRTVSNPTLPTPILPDPLPSTPEYVVVVITSGHIGRSRDFFDTATPTWDDISTGLPAGCTMYNLQIGGGRAWLIVINSGSYDLYYCASLFATTPTWSLVLTDVAARAYSGVWVGHHNKAMAVTDTGVCYLAAQISPYSTTVRYWRCVTGAVAGYEFVTAGSGSCEGDNPSNAACDDGVDIYLSGDNAVTPGSLNWLSPTLGTSGAVAGIRTGYAISSAHFVDALGNMYTLAGALVHTSALVAGQIKEIDGHTFWISGATNYIMIDSAIQAVPNDSDGGTGTFSATGAMGSSYYAFRTTYAEILWTAQSAAAANSKCSIAYTANGGVLWQSKDGDWASVFGAYEGGVTSMIRVGYNE